MQNADAGTNPANPFTYPGPYSLEIANVDLEDATGHALSLYGDLNRGFKVNDVYIHDSYIVSSAVTGILMGANSNSAVQGQNYVDTKTCDSNPNWPNDTTSIYMPRDIRIEKTNFLYNNTGAIGGAARWVALQNQNTFTSNYINPQAGNVAGGTVEFDACADTINIAGNTMTGPSVAIDTGGLELYGRNITVQGNSITGFPSEGIALNSVYNTQISGANQLTNNNHSTAGDAGGVVVWTIQFPGECTQVARDTDQVTISGNNISSPYSAILLGQYPFLLSTDTIKSLTITGNTLSTPGVGIQKFVAETGYSGPTTSAGGSADTPRDFPVDARTPATSRCGCIPLDKEQVCSATPTDVETFTFSGAELTGGNNITAIEGLFSLNGTPQADVDGTGGVMPPVCHILYVPAANKVYLDSTSGNGTWIGSSVLGANGTDLSNTSCTVHPKTSTGSIQPFNASFTVDMQFPSGSNAHMHIYERVQNNVNCTNGECNSAPSGWQYWGYIPVP